MLHSFRLKISFFLRARADIRQRLGPRKAEDFFTCNHRLTDVKTVGCSRNFSVIALRY